jgi:hypothetical protein
VYEILLLYKIVRNLSGYYKNIRTAFVILSQMKQKLYLLAWVLLLTTCSYGQMVNIENDKADTIIQANNLLLENALKNALAVAQEVVNRKYYFTEFEIPNKDSFTVVTVNITMGHLFSNKQKHLLIRRITLWGVYIDLFLVTDEVLKSVIYREQYGMTYIKDTIRDINGDGLKDFVIHWSPSSGCCKRDIYSVYLSQADQETFINEYRFVNPTFSPKEKLVRGVGYGYPEAISLYKYKWDGIMIDPIEFIYHDVTNKGKYIRTATRKHNPSEKDGELLDTVPKEYHYIDGFDWFTDF